MRGGRWIELDPAFVDASRFGSPVVRALRHIATGHLLVLKTPQGSRHDWELWLGLAHIASAVRLVDGKKAPTPWARDWIRKGKEKANETLGNSTDDQGPQQAA
jgi:hypothetical protein